MVLLVLVHRPRAYRRAGASRPPARRPGRVRGGDRAAEIDGLGAPVDPKRGRIVPSAPADLYAALGYGGQVVLVHPASRTVVVRLGDPGDVRGSADYGISGRRPRAAPRP